MTNGTDVQLSKVAVKFSLSSTTSKEGYEIQVWDGASDDEATSALELAKKIRLSARQALGLEEKHDND